MDKSKINSGINEGCGILAIFTSIRKTLGKK
jgi:hypothetical protein